MEIEIRASIVVVAILEAILDVLITTEEICVLYKYIIEMGVPHNLIKDIKYYFKVCINYIYA